MRATSRSTVIVRVWPPITWGVPSCLSLIVNSFQRFPRPSKTLWVLFLYIILWLISDCNWAVYAEFIPIMLKIVPIMPKVMPKLVHSIICWKASKVNNYCRYTVTCTVQKHHGKFSVIHHTAIIWGLCHWAMGLRHGLKTPGMVLSHYAQIILALCSTLSGTYAQNYASIIHSLPDHKEPLYTAWCSLRCVGFSG